MDRRRGLATRPASSEGKFNRFFGLHLITLFLTSEVECWSHAAESLTALSNKYSNHPTLETIERVNRLISAWPIDDVLPAEGFDGVKSIYKKLAPGLRDIQMAAEQEAK